MKKIEAVIQPVKLDNVIDALEAVPGVTTVTVTEVRTFGIVATSGERVRDARKFKIEITAQDALVAEVVAQIVDAAHTGRPGDGRVNVLPVEQSINIRSRE
ncbi:MAG: P-II family nitrogen regulator [Armatimonadota bacterium]